MEGGAKIITKINETNDKNMGDGLLIMQKLFILKNRRKIYAVFMGRVNKHK